MNTPLNPFYIICSGIPIFPISDPRNCGDSLKPPCAIYGLSKTINNIFFFLVNFSIFTAEKKSLYIEWASFRNGSNFTLVLLFLISTEK